MDLFLHVYKFISFPLTPSLHNFLIYLVLLPFTNIPFKEMLETVKPKISPQHFPMLLNLYRENPSMLEALGVSAVIIKGEIERSETREELAHLDDSSFLEKVYIVYMKGMRIQKSEEKKRD